MAEASIAKDRPRRAVNLLHFTDTEFEEVEDEQEQDVFQRPKTPPKKSKKQNKSDIELEKEKLAIEKEKLAIEKERLEIERERIRLQRNDNHNINKQSLPFKVKLQPFDPVRDDILTFLSEFDAISEQAKWTNELRILQLRTLLTGEARHVSAQASTSYDDLRSALIDRYGKRPHEYFSDLLSVRKKDNETYRALMSRISQSLKRTIKDKDPIKCLQDEFFLKALPPAQAQWVRRNKGSASVVEAAEDYIGPPKTIDSQRKNFNNSNKKNDSAQVSESRPKNDNIRCYKCKNVGHYARDCGKSEKTEKKTGNPASYLVKPNIGQRLIYVPGEVNGKQVSFVKDTGADMTLIREDLVEKKNILEGQNVTLHTAIGQPFHAKLAMVEMNTPYYKGVAQVGLVPELAAEALLGMDILERGIFVVTRAQAKQQQEEDEIAEDNVVDRVIEQPPQIHDIADNEEITLANISSVNAELLAKLQQEDDSLSNIRSKVVENLDDDQPNAFYWDNNILMRRWKTKDGRKSGTQVVVPLRLRHAVMKIAHDQPMAGHLGIEKTKDRVLASFYWPGIFRDIQDYCSQCDVCQKTAKRRASEKNPLITTPIIQEPFRKISMDIVGPLDRTKRGNKYILTVVDEATRYPEAFPLKNIEAKTIADALIQLFSRVGVANTILTDQGSNFTSQLLKDLYQVLGARGCTTSPYRPQSNGRCERFNGTLKSMLKKLCTENEEEWDDLIPYALFAYREVPHEETGFSPFELLYGWPVRGPLAILRGLFTGEDETHRSVVDHVVTIRDRLADTAEMIKENLTKRKAKIKTWYDKQARFREFDPGDEVLVLLPSDTSKMKAMWKGPYRVVRKISDVNYQINVGGRRGIVTYHINMLRKYNRSVLFTSMNSDDESDCLVDICMEEESIHDIKLDGLLDKEKREEIRKLCEEFSDVVNSKPGLTDIITHDVKTTSEKPITLKPYRIPQAIRADVKQAVDEMLDQGIIEPSNSPWSAPIVPIRKRDGTLRICVDYRRINQITQFDAYATPRMDELFDKLGDAKFISRLDMTKGYFQVPLAEKAREKSAFVTPFGQYQFRVMPFGMKTSAATFIRMVDILIAPLQNIVAYFDDIVVYSRTWEEHLQNLRQLFERLREKHLTVRPSKCEFGAQKIKCLGHVVGNGQITTDKSKVKAMLDFPLPTDKKGLRSFLGMVGYYRKHVKNFAEIAVPLTEMTKKNKPNKLQWTETSVKSFRDLKLALTQAPVLVTPDFSKPFILQTDASDTSIGAVLSQVVDKDEHPIAYISRKLLPRERNYATIEKECLAIIWAIETFRYYLFGNSFSVETDHNPLVWLNQVKTKSQRLLRWSLALQPYDFAIRYRKGSSNNADALSRI